MENQRAFLDSIGLKIGVKDPTDLSPWYNVDQGVLIKSGIRGLLVTYYDSSHYLMLKKVYPEYKWLPWKFRSLPRSVVDDPQVLEDSLAYVEKEKKLEKLEDWYSVSQNDLKKLGVYSIISKYGRLPDVLRKFRPSIEWDESLFSKRSSRRHSFKESI